MRNQYYCCLPLCVVIAMAQGKVGCLDETIIDLSALRAMVGNGGDINLYSPDLEVIEICWKETLQCFKSELFVLNFEFDGTWKQNVSQLISKLDDSFEHILMYLDASSNCKHCEIYKEETAKNFLKNLERFLQYHNRYSCPALPF